MQKCKKTEDEHKKEDKQVTGTEESCCKIICSKWSNIFDISRLVISEVIFYPLLICDLFEVIVGRGLEGKSPGDIVGIILFVVSLLSMIITVYIARIVILLAMVVNTSNVSTPDKNLVKEDGTLPSEHNPEILKSNFWYRVSFCVHVILQMLAQVVMYIAIAAKIRYDNRHFYRSGNTDENIYASSYLWYMMFAGFVTPTLGLISFFVVTHYWSQQYPIGYRIQTMEIFRMTLIGTHEVLSMKKTIQEGNRKLAESFKGENKKAMLANFLSVFTPLKNEFSELFKKSWGEKFLYPFKAPMLVVICLVYAALQLAFVICAAQAVDEMGTVVTHVLNGGTWVIFYIFAIIVGFIANVYSFLVAGVWIAIVAIVLAVIAMVIATIVGCLALVCGVLMCGSSNRNNINTRRL